MRRFELAVLGIAAIAAAAMPPSARAAEKVPPRAARPAGQVLGNEGAWSAYVGDDTTGKVCYLVGQPAKSVPAVRRRQPSASVTHRPGEHVADVVSFDEGYKLKPGSEVALGVGGRRFELFVSGDAAWARTSALDREIVETLARSREAVARGIPARGPATTDTYSLVGFAKMLALIDAACDVRR